MVRAGLPLDGALLSLAAASHSGEERHLVGTLRILQHAGLTEDHLRNVPDLPLDPAVRDTWVRAGRGPSRLAQNCSGKHAAMLCTAKLNGWPVDDYLDPSHPLQQLIAETVEDLTGRRVATVTVDGCGAPPVRGLPGGPGPCRRPHRERCARHSRGPGRRRDAHARRDGVRHGP